nr:hypothetical protein BaRGS_001484 [Batillaria attramentaria]
MDGLRVFGDLINTEVGAKGNGNRKQGTHGIQLKVKYLMNCVRVCCAQMNTFPEQKSNRWAHSIGVNGNEKGLGPV